MPPRLVSLGILVFWALAASALVVRDVVPDLIVGPPPDLRDVARAGRSDLPVKWMILVKDEHAPEGGMRSVGQVTTRTERRHDGWIGMKSEVWLDSEGLLRGTPLESAAGGRLDIVSNIEIDSAGNLNMFRSAVRLDRDPTDLLVIEGHLADESIAVQARGKLFPWTWARRFPYQARGMVQNNLGPLDRMPNLRKGQRWVSQVVSPLTGQVETVKVEVAPRNALLHWGAGPVPTLEVITRFSGMSARTWVRADDGLVLRQEVPLLFQTLTLERMPDEPGQIGRSDDRGRELP